MNIREAFTYIELMIVVVVAAILTLSFFSSTNTAGQEDGQLAGERFAADVAYARSLSIARPDSPVIIKVDTATNRYWLAPAATPDVPITHPTTKQPYVVSFGPGGNTGLRQAQIISCDLGGDAVLGFDAVGGTDQATVAAIHVSSAGTNYEVDVQPIGAVARVSRLVNLETMPTADGQVMQD